MTTATIWKFKIPIEDEFSIKMPQDAELLFVATQDDIGCLWARVEPRRKSEYRKFKLRGTGHVVDINCKHIGSFLLKNGALVFHLFEDQK